jgi:hypothetical protein
MTMRDKDRQRIKRSDESDADSDEADRGADQDASDPPGTVSNQNGEEAETGLLEDQTHPETRSSR